jgi:anti-anti-sigma factor
MRNFEIETQRDVDVLIVRPGGYINDQGGERLREECETALAENLRNIIIDFHTSEHINSVGIASIIAIIERIDELGGRLVFTGLSATVREVFEIMGITRHVSVAEDAESARSILSSPDTHP